jgi:NADPH:quinone reductase
MDTRALVIEHFDDTPHLAPVPIPDIGPRDVVIEVRAASVNAFDWKAAEGRFKDTFEYRFPMTVGRDYAGIVQAVGPEVERVRVGDDVFGYFTGQTLHRGSYANHVWCTDDECFVRKPPELDYMEASCLPLCGVIALRCVDAVVSGAGEHVLVLGAPGGVGSYVVQLASRRGAHVIATGAPEDDDYLRSLGASQVVHRSDELLEAVRDLRPGGLDGLVDLVNYRPGFLAFVDLLAPGGRAASTHRAVDADQFAARELSGTNVTSAPDRALLDRLASLAANGELRIPIQRVFGLDQADEALVVARTGHSRGKMVIAVGDGLDGLYAPESAGGLA